MMVKDRIQIHFFEFKELYPKENYGQVYFSSGGNISLLISDYLVKSKNQIKAKGVFIVDSPIDLLGLYKTSEKNLKLNFSQQSVQESNWIITQFDMDFGNPSNELKKANLITYFESLSKKKNLNTKST